MGRKGLSIWLFSSLTVISLVHATDALSALIWDKPIRLLQLYPFISEELQAATPATYFLTSVTACLIFWGITCAIAFENPFEAFLNQVLSDAKQKGDIENQLIEDKGEVLDAMYETLQTSNEILASVSDVVHNVRTEVKEIQPLKESVEKIRTELASLKREVRKIDEKSALASLCPACGKSLLPEFNVCPFCGENLKLSQPPIIRLKNYK